MKHLRFSLLALVFLLVSGLAASAQTVEEIINKHITAIGGAENWKKINSVKMTGSMNAGGTEIPVTIVTKHKKAMRVDFTVGGMTGYSIITDKAGWSFMPFAGQTKPEAMSEDDVKKSQEQLDVQGEFIDYKNKGLKITYVGKDDVEGTECFKLKVVYPNGKEESCFIDASNYYHIRSVSKATVNGKEVEATANFGNFQKLPEGVVYPMTIDQGMGQIALKSVEINKPIDESLFAPKG